MLFNSNIFLLIFLPLTLLMFYCVGNNKKSRLSVLICASLIFYGFWSPKFLLLLISSAAWNWFVVKIFARYSIRSLPIIGVCFNLFVIGIFKYADFFAANLEWVIGMQHQSFDIVLPLGISFFTFQQISYLVDVHRGSRQFYSFMDYFLFVTFFPQLVAGPIVRHDEIIEQFDSSPICPKMWENLSRGILLFVFGLAKKIIIADEVATLSTPLFEKAAAGSQLAFGESWLAAGAYTLQIYYDFSGYSDMAIGIGLMCGFSLPINFNAPYRAISIRDFWRRWHITLSRFLRDYLYIPLGGNMNGAIRQVINVLITMLLGGLWHGASWTFVVWGGLHGAALAVNSLWKRKNLPMPLILGWIITLLFIIFSWVLFRADSFSTAIQIFSSMLGLNGLVLCKIPNTILLIMAALLAIIGPTSQRFSLELFRPFRLLAVPVAMLFVYLLLLIGGDSPSEFIYFQF